MISEISFARRNGTASTLEHVTCISRSFVNLGLTTIRRPLCASLQPIAASLPAVLASSYVLCTMCSIRSAEPNLAGPTAEKRQWVGNLGGRRTIHCCPGNIAATYLPCKKNSTTTSFFSDSKSSLMPYTFIHMPPTAT